jgi:nucleoside-diphosphate-sugar epimerase
MRVALSGANGFVGRVLIPQLVLSGHQVLSYVRRSKKFAKTTGVIPLVAPDLSLYGDWRLSSAQGVDVFVHCAARAHVMSDTSTDPLAEFRRVNVDGTVSLARQAAAAGVKRFIYLSSIKVNGESTQLGRPFTAEDIPRPQDPYGVSKYEAERALLKIAEETGMEVVIIRPPLVYGPGVKANFASMMHIVQRGVPLPLASVTGNQRSLVALGNLIDLIVTCINHPAAANQTFLVSDDEDVSTAELLRRMGLALKKPAKLFYVPSLLLHFGAVLLNKSEIYQRLSGSLQVDITKTKDLLHWKPPLSLDQGLKQLIKDEL